MDVITEAELLERITAFRERHENMAPTTFGRRATGNANLVKELEEGKSPSLRTAQKIAAFMKQADEEARLREKLSAPLEPVGSEGEAVPNELPFGTAPANPAGATSPTCSSTSERQHAPGATSCSRCSAGSDDER